MVGSDAFLMWFFSRMYDPKQIAKCQQIYGSDNDSAIYCRNAKSFSYYYYLNERNSNALTATEIDGEKKAKKCIKYFALLIWPQLIISNANNLHSHRRWRDA